MVGKLLNAGQTCIAPDYVLVPAGREQAFVEAARAVVAKCFPAMATTPDYTSIVNESHYQRLQGYVDDARERGAGSNRCRRPRPTPTRRRLPPLALLDVNDEHARDAGRDLRPAAAGAALCRPRRRDRPCEPASAPAGPVLLRQRRRPSATAC
jgi:hypothetical protein